MRTTRIGRSRWKSSLLCRVDLGNFCPRSSPVRSSHPYALIRYDASAMTSMQKPVPAEKLLRPKMPELDTIRGIAVLLVLFFHGFSFRYGLSGLSGFPKLLVEATLPGWMGVDLFFVLSGFLIMSFFYLSNVTELFGVPMQYGVLWSLAVEEHFYLIWPAFVRSLSRRRVAIAALTICFICPCLRAFYFLRNYNTGTGYTWLVADGLATGAFLSAVARGPWGTRSRMWSVAAVFLTLSLIMFQAGHPFGIFLASRFLGMTLRGTALNLFFAGSIASALLIGTSNWKAIVNRPMLQFFGDISYGVYLIHMLVFDLEDHLVGKWLPSLSSPSGHFSQMILLFAIATSVIVAVASLSRWHFEEPFLRMKKGFEGPSTKPDSTTKATARPLG